MRFFRLGSAVAAMILAIGLTGTAASARADSGGTGAVTVMLLTTSGAKLDLANVVVNLSGQASSYYENEFTTAHGRATFSKVPAGVAYTALVYQRGDQGAWARLSAYRSTPMITSGHHVWVALTMRLAASVSGRIVDSSGTPVTGTVRAYGRTTRESEFATTDSDGRYTVVGLPTDTYLLEFSGPGIQTKIFRGALPVTAQQGTAPPSRLTDVNTIVAPTF